MNSKDFSIISPLYSNKYSYPEKGRFNLLGIKNYHYKLLQHNLKQLEIILSFEMNLDNNNLDKYSLSFLQEFEKIKHIAQINTIESIHYCRSYIKKLITTRRHLSVIHRHLL